MKQFTRAILVCLFIFSFGGLLQAQATRTWVSGIGDDANPCSRTAACRTFAGAISKTAEGGEINVLDPGPFGTLYITKSISIVAEGNTAGVLAAFTTGFVIEAGPTDKVVLRGLDIEGAGTGTHGIRFISGGILHVEDCTIHGFTQRGILFEPSAASRLFVEDTIIRAAFTGGIYVNPGVSGSALVTLDNVRLLDNQFGVRADNNSKVFVKDTVASGNTTNGFIAFTTGPMSEIFLESSSSSHNGTNGIKSEGPGAVVRISRTAVTNNSTGLSTASGGQIISFSNNAVGGNGVNGAPSQTVGED